MQGKPYFTRRATLPSLCQQQGEGLSHMKQDATNAGEFKVSRRLAKDQQEFQTQACNSIGLGRKHADFFLSLPKSFIRLVTHMFISEIF